MKRNLIYLALFYLSFCSVSFAQVSLSVGTSHKFRTDRKYDNGGDSWFLGLNRSEFTEHTALNSHTLGIDFSQGSFTLMADVSLWTNKLLVNSIRSDSKGSSMGSKNSTTTHSYSIDYGYVGLHLSPQRVYQLFKNTELRVGPLVEVSTRIFERERNHLKRYTYSSNYYYGWAQDYIQYSSESTSKEEFNGMDLEKYAILIGGTLSPAYRYKRFDFILNLSGGIGSAFRRDITAEPGIWDEKMYFWGEIGLRVAYQLKRQD